MFKLPIAGLAAAAAIITASVQEEENLADTGKWLAEQHCAKCHAIQGAGPSPHEDAPPFAALAAKWPLQKFEDAFRAGILAEHPDMPFFMPEEDQLIALIEYFYTLTPEGCEASGDNTSGR
jgi:cytochrome c